MTIETAPIDWQAIADRMDERIRKYDWPRPLPPQCPQCGGTKCRLRAGGRYRCIYCCYEACLAVPVSRGAEP